MSGRLLPTKDYLEKGIVLLLIGPKNSNNNYISIRPYLPTKCPPTGLHGLILGVGAFESVRFVHK
jgi:hypothetical protein